MIAAAGTEDRMMADGPPLRMPPAALSLPLSELGEGPCWDDATNSLYWVDIPACQVLRLTDDGAVASWDAGQPVGAVALREGGGLVLAAEDGFCALDLATGALGRLAEVDHGQPGIRMNDGACDRAGRFFAGSMASDETPGAGALYRLDPDHSVTRLVTGVGISNGIGWSPDDTLMYYVDSLTYQLDVFDYDPATGALDGRRAFASLGSGGVMPDGLTVDADGSVWVALWGGSAVHCYSPAGQLTQVLDLPAANVTSCAFGGRDLATLYITTAAGPGQSAGALFSCRPGATGVPASRYRG
jgi:sugar lactone lactonase YvrE